MNILNKSAAVTALVMTIASPAFAMSDAHMTRIISMGFDRAVVESLSSKSISAIERALSNGSDSEARMVVNSIILNAMAMSMMK